MYKLQYSKKSAKYIQKLPLLYQKRLIAALERARISPGRYFERLVGKETYKLRVGNYRIIADIHKGDLRILVIEIGHRKNIYK